MNKYDEAFKKMCELDYEDLEELLKDGITQFKIKAYGEGYEQGKFDAAMDSAIEKYDGALRKMAEETPQQKRDRIIEKAKKDIDGLRHKESGFYRVAIRERIFAQYCTVKFHVNKDKRTVVALLRGFRTGKVWARGIAKCAPNDCFNVHIGKAIALRRALGLEVPDEYLNAPQPTRVRKGDIVESTIHGKDHVFKVEVGSGEKPIAGKPHADAIYVKRAKIIDDSREEATK